MHITSLLSFVNTVRYLQLELCFFANIGQVAGKAKPARKKTDFNKEYRDNIYVESDRAKYEYMLTEE